MKTIDNQTMTDVVGLIEAEMGSTGGIYANSAQRLASVIVGRLGYETPKKSCLPGVTEGKWIAKPSGNELVDSGFRSLVRLKPGYAIRSGDKLVAYVRKEANARLMAASKGIAEALYNMVMTFDRVPGAPMLSSAIEESPDSVHSMAVKALKEAGYDI